MDLFPNGWVPYLVGGLLAGTGVGAIFLLTGLRAGASSVLTTTWSFGSRLAYFQRDEFVKARTWRLYFALGLVVGAALYTLVDARLGGAGRQFVTQVAPWRLLVGGLFVGFGTRLSRGCTSGHGICGISAGAKPSIAAVLVFMGVAVAVAQALEAAGVTP